ncbi:deoxyguanosinetriphosphate triphosphohydrolase [Lichenicoccus sp.]|uniref:deoxyguanosinetriphosphate triphosphohydrolase n=1 Tax=Lichenicoccus sp. TaxID=2781899 RepID=UPI003D14DA8E
MQPAPYAVRVETARGRLHPEPEAATRSPWQRDRDRVIHSAAFRKLQYKTQVFVNHEGDFFRTRLTHSLEVAQIARSIARALDLNEDLTEALALAHDLGHTPFGHAGEEALRGAMLGRGGFDHNTQSIRIVALLERRYAAFDGLNLTWESLEGLAKHNGPVRDPSPYLVEYDRGHPLDLASHASAEAQVASMSDDIAYHGHDLDDGLRAGLLDIADLAAVPVVGAALDEARACCAARPGASRLRHETIRRVIDRLASDLTEESRRRLAALAPRDADAIRRHDRPVIGFSAVMAEQNAAIRSFLHARLYRHWRVNRMTVKARQVTATLFSILSENPGLLPDGWRENAVIEGGEAAHRVVADYIAGMTDRFAIEEHRRLTDPAIPG